MSDFRLRSLAGWSALFTGLALLILFAHWPWPMHFSTGFVHHFDPPFHAWKLSLVAEHIQQGRILPAEGNTNCFFPNSGALYYEALHWPQALLAAGLLRFTDNPVLVYHLTLLLFWAFSGVVMAGLLRELGAGRGASAVGAALFCVIPYRTSYFVEFNMQLVAGLALFLWFGVRLFRRPGFWNGLGLGLAFWFQAASELYQAIILLCAAPLVFLPLLTSRGWRILQDRRYHLAVAGFLLTVPLTLYFVNGYRCLNRQAAFSRGVQEMRRHRLEPASYLLPPGREALLPGVRAHKDEMSPYPTLAVFFASAYYMWQRRRRRDWDLAAPDTPHNRLRPPGARLRLEAVVQHGRTLGLLAFAGVFLWLQYAAQPPAWSGRLFNAAILAATVFCVLASFLPARSTDRDRFLAGLGSAAWLCFVMSLGPTILLIQNQWKTPSLLFGLVHQVVPFLSAMRVISRFSVMVQIYLVVIASLGWEAWAARRSRWWAGLSAAVVITAVLLESRTWGRRFDPFDAYTASPVLTQLAPPGSSTLLVLPFHERFHASRHMLAIGRHERPMLYGWGGFYPRFQQELLRTFGEARMDEFAALVGEVWPPTEVLVQHTVPPTPLAPNLRWSCSRQLKLLAPYFEVAAEDGQFTLLRLRPVTDAVVSCARQTRADYLDRNPRILFTARAEGEPPVYLAVLVNGAWYGEVTLSAAERSFTFVVPASWRNRIHPNRVQLRSLDDRPWRVSRLECAPGTAPLPSGCIPVEPSAPRVTRWPAWMNHVPERPPSSVSVPIRFEQGLRLLACEPAQPEVRAGDSVSFRFHWAHDSECAVLRPLVHFVHAKRDRGICFQDDRIVFDDLPPGEVAVQPYVKIQTTTSVLEVPTGTPPGLYTLWTGLHEHMADRRLDGISPLESKSRAFRLPVEVKVVAQGP